MKLFSPFLVLALFALVLASCETTTISGSRIFGLSDDQVCGLATDKYGNWDTTPFYAKHVAEARRRGLSCNGSTSTRSVARSTTTSASPRKAPAPSRRAPNSNSGDVSIHADDSLICLMATGVYPSQKHVAEARRRGLSCNGSTSTRSVARSTTTSTPSRSRPSSVVQSSGNITFCYDPSQTLAYRTEKPSCDTNDFEITSTEYDRRRMCSVVQQAVYS